MTLSAGDSPANHSQKQGNSKARATIVTSGLKCLESFKRSDPLGLLVKTLLTSSRWYSTLYSLTWKVQATPAKRLIFRLAASRPRTKGNVFGLLGTTPTTQEKPWPTPMAKDHTVIAECDLTRNKLRAEVVKEFSGGKTLKDINKAIEQHGSLNPDWEEVLMGFPVGWTDPTKDNVGRERLPYPAPRMASRLPHEPPLLAKPTPYRSERLKAIGNAVAPEIPEIIGEAIIRSTKAG